MIVYSNTPEPRPKHEMYVTPSRNSDSVEFKDVTGRPVMFQVVFEHGRAEVPENLGRWMVDNGMAIRSRIILPARHLFRTLTK